jgi:hypothetical protein
VILLTAEDGLGDTVRPRLDALGADVNRVHVLTAVMEGEAERPVSLETDLAAIEAAILRTGALLVIVDPISAYLGRISAIKDTEVRRVLTPFADVAERTGAAILAIMHLNKDAQKRAVYRASGSVAFTAVPRVVLAVAEDPDDSRRRLLLPIKNNLSAPAAVLAFRFDDGGRLQWEPGVVAGVTADEVLGEGPEGRRSGTRRARAEAFLQELLAAGPADQQEVERAASDAGITTRTLRRAKGALGVVSRRIGGAGAEGRWVWALPEGAERG